MPTFPDYVFKFHKRGGHEVTYVVIAQETGNTSYYQYKNIDTHWYIMKAVRSSNVTLYTFTVPVKTDSDAGWTGRPALDYVDFAVAFA